MNAPKWDETEAYTPPAASSAPTATATAPKWDDTEEVAAPGSEKSVGGFLGNAVSDAGNIVGGVASLAGNMVTHPIDTTVNTVKGIPTAVKDLAHAWGIPEVMHGQFADAIKKIGNSLYDKPVSRALDVASVAMPALKAAGVVKGVEGAELASKAGELGDAAADTSAIYRAKNLGARTKAFSELGEPEAIRIGNRAKELELTGGAKDTLAKGNEMLKGTGDEIGQMRKTGDALHAAPTMDEINAAIERELKDKYTTGLGAGEGTEFNRAVEDVNKLNPKAPPTLTKVDGLQQMGMPSQEMDLFKNHAQPELFPEGPTESMVMPKTKEVPNPAFKAPGTSEFAQKATDMNDWARNEKSLLRPSGAASDVANVVSGENDANLVHALGPEHGKGYLDTLEKHSDLKTMTQMLAEKRARELGTSTAPGSLPARAVNFAKDRFGYRMTSAGLDKIASFLKTNPEKFGKYAEVLNHAMVGGPAALATTVDLLAQNDPAFAQQMEGLK